MYFVWYKGKIIKFDTDFVKPKLSSSYKLSFGGLPVRIYDGRDHLDPNHDPAIRANCHVYDVGDFNKPSWGFAI